MINSLECPLLKRKIDLGYCLEISDSVDGMIKKDMLNDDITKIKNYESICKSCKYHGK